MFVNLKSHSFLSCSNPFPDSSFTLLHFCVNIIFLLLFRLVGGLLPPYPPRVQVLGQGDEEKRRGNLWGKRLYFARSNTFINCTFSLISILFLSVNIRRFSLVSISRSPSHCYIPDIEIDSRVPPVFRDMHDVSRVRYATKRPE